MPISRRSPADCTDSCRSSVPAAAQFQEASTDGSKVVFSSPQRLTDEASQGQENIYLYDFDNPVGHELIDVSAGDASGLGPRVIGAVAVSPDGSHVYFAARGVLTSSPNTQGQHAQEGQSNLYVYERDADHPEGRIAFIADADVAVGFGNFENVANVTPDGRFLVFTSASRLTPDDTSVSGAQQVFRYDAQTGELIRISIGNDGFNDNGNRSTPTSCAPSGSPGCESARTVLAADRERRDPTMSHDGSYVFFQSPVGLTPQALDRVPAVGGYPGETTYAENVYEWHAGHVYLISDGRDTGYDQGQNAICGSGSTVCLFESDATGAQRAVLDRRFVGAGRHRHAARLLRCADLYGRRTVHKTGTTCDCRRVSVKPVMAHRRAHRWRRGCPARPSTAKETCPRPP